MNPCLSDKNESILQLAISSFGRTSRINMAIEEAGELITVLAKRNRRDNGSTLDEIVDEMVDMQIMLDQLKIIFNDGDDYFEKTMIKKMARLSKIVQSKREENNG